MQIYKVDTFSSVFIFQMLFAITLILLLTPLPSHAGPHSRHYDKRNPCKSIRLTLEIEGTEVIETKCTVASLKRPLGKGLQCAQLKRSVQIGGEYVHIDDGCEPRCINAGCKDLHQK